MLLPQPPHLPRQNLHLVLRLDSHIKLQNEKKRKEKSKIKLEKALKNVRRSGCQPPSCALLKIHFKYQQQESLLRTQTLSNGLSQVFIGLIPVNAFSQWNAGILDGI